MKPCKRCGWNDPPPGSDGLCRFCYEKQDVKHYKSRKSKDQFAKRHRWGRQLEAELVNLRKEKTWMTKALGLSKPFFNQIINGYRTFTPDVYEKILELVPAMRGFPKPPLASPPKPKPATKPAQQVLPMPTPEVVRVSTLLNELLVEQKKTNELLATIDRNTNLYKHTEWLRKQEKINGSMFDPPPAYDPDPASGLDNEH